MGVHNHLTRYRSQALLDADRARGEKKPTYEPHPSRGIVSVDYFTVSYQALMSSAISSPPYACQSSTHWSQASMSRLPTIMST